MRLVYKNLPQPLSFSVACLRIVSLVPERRPAWDPFPPPGVGGGGRGWRRHGRGDVVIVVGRRKMMMVVRVGLPGFTRSFVCFTGQSPWHSFLLFRGFFVILRAQDKARIPIPLYPYKLTPIRFTHTQTKLEILI